MRKSLWLPNQKPLGPVELDWDNWLLKKINPVGIYVFQDDVPVNLVTGIPAVAHLTPTPVIDRDGGRAVYSPADGTYGGTTASFWDTKIKADNSFRFLATWQRYYATPIVDQFYNGIHDGTRRFYLNPIGTATNNLYFSWGNTAYSPAATRTAPMAGQREMLAMSVNLSGNIQGYINGAAFGAASSAASFDGTTTRNFYIGKRTNNSSTEDGSTGVGGANSTDLVIIGRGDLNAAEVAELYRNPYQILKPKKASLIVFTEGGGGEVNATSSSSQIQTNTTNISLNSSFAVSTNQVQNTTSSLERIVSCTNSSSQVQISTSTLVLGSSISSSQVQSSSINTILETTSNSASSQIQNSTSSFAVATSCTSTSSQVQSNTSVLDASGIVSCSVTSNQVQISTIATSLSASCTISSKQVQTANIITPIGIVVTNRGGKSKKKKIPRWLKNLIEDLEEDGKEKVVKEVKIEVLEKAIEELPYFDLDTKSIYLTLDVINKEIIRKKKKRKKQNEEILLLFL